MAESSNESPDRVQDHRTEPIPTIRRPPRPRRLFGMCVLASVVGVFALAIFTVFGILGQVIFAGSGFPTHIFTVVSMAVFSLVQFPIDATRWWLGWMRFDWRRGVWPIMFLAGCALLSQSLIYWFRLGKDPSNFLFPLILQLVFSAALWPMFWLSSAWFGVQISEPNQITARRTITLTKMMVFSACFAVALFLGLKFQIPNTLVYYGSRAKTIFQIAQIGGVIVTICWTVACWTILWFAWRRYKKKLVPIMLVGCSLIEIVVQSGTSFLSIHGVEFGMPEIQSFFKPGTLFGLFVGALLTNGLRLTTFAFVEYCGYSIEIVRRRAV